MEEVKALLIQAWLKAKENGVHLESVDFLTYRSSTDEGIRDIEMKARFE